MWKDPPKHLLTRLLGVQENTSSEGTVNFWINMGFPKMVVPNNHGVFLQKMIILGCFEGATIQGNTHMNPSDIFCFWAWLPEGYYQARGIAPSLWWKVLRYFPKLGALSANSANIKMKTKNIWSTCFGFACSMLGKSSKNILPNGGLMVIYHGCNIPFRSIWIWIFDVFDVQTEYFFLDGWQKPPTTSQYVVCV